MKVKVGDNVKILAGKDKGKEGKIIRTLRNKDKVVVEGINVHKYGAHIFHTSDEEVWKFINKITKGEQLGLDESGVTNVKVLVEKSFSSINFYDTLCNIVL